MNIASVSKIALTVALSAGTTVAAAADHVTIGRDGDFIEPLPLRLVMSRNDPRRPQLCNQVGRLGQCPPILIHGGQQGGGIPMIEAGFKANLPNVRVSFVVQSIMHEAIAGGGVLGNNPAGDFVVWETHGPAADVENSGPYGWGLPPAGETWDDNDLTVYDALVFGACENFAGFPVTHSAVANNNLVPVGEFEGTDNSTLDSTGFYNLNYTIEAQNGTAVSHFHVSGKVNVTCSGANSL